MSIHEKLLPDNYRHLVEHLPYALLIENRQGNVVSMNHLFCQLFGIDWRLTPMVGCRTLQVLEGLQHQLAVPQLLLQHPTDLAQLPTSIQTDELLLADGRTVLRTASVIHQYGQYGGCVWTFQDISDKVQLLQEKNERIDALLQQNKLKDKLLAIVSHDLRSPIAILKSYLALSNKQGLTSADAAFFQKHLAQSFESASNLLDNLLDWARMQLNDNRLNRQKQSLQPLIASCVGLLSPIAQGKRISLVNDIPPATSANTDAAVFQLVFRNLLHNALKFTPEGGSVCLSRSYANNCLIVSVTDTATPLNEQQIQQIWNYQANGRSNARQDGSAGLGLWLCKQYIEQQGGKLWVTAEAAGGNKFSFSIPKY